MKSEISPSLANSNLILASHITGVYDVNRNTTLQDNNYELVRNWAESLSAAHLQGIIFHNNFTAKPVKNLKTSMFLLLKWITIITSIPMYIVTLFTETFCSKRYIGSKISLLLTCQM